MVTDDDVTRNLPDGRFGMPYDDFRSLIPTWPEWLRVEGRGVMSGPDSGVVYHARYLGRRFAVVAPRELETGHDFKCHLYGITDGQFGVTWRPLQTERATDAPEVWERVRRLRRCLPEILEDHDLAVLGRDGEPSDHDRQWEGARLRWKAYARWSETWDHDHCVICGATFSLDRPDGLTAGHAVQGGPQGDDYHWICGSCVDERRGLVHFEIQAGPDETSHDSWDGGA